MAADRPSPPPDDFLPLPGGTGPSGITTAEFKAWADRAPRSRVAVPVLCRFSSFIDFVETQSVNISRSGMFLSCETPPEMGTKIDFEIGLDDGYVVLRGTGIVVRVVTATEPRGMGVRFLDLDDGSRKLIDRIVEVNAEEGKHPSVPFDFSRPATGKTLIPTRANPITAQSIMEAAAAPKPIVFDGDKLRLVLSASTVSYFTYNPLLNIKMAGFFIPAETEHALGTTFRVEIVDATGAVLASGKGKVVAKQELRIGVRLSEVDKDTLAKLQAQVARLAAK